MVNVKNIARAVIVVFTAAICIGGVYTVGSGGTASPGDAVEVVLKNPPNNYFAQTRDGKVIIYDANDRQNAYYVTEINVASLRMYDQQLLQEGIYLENDLQLQQLLEDFDA